MLLLHTRAHSSRDKGQPGLRTATDKDLVAEFNQHLSITPAVEHRRRRHQRIIQRREERCASQTSEKRGLLLLYPCGRLPLSGVMQSRSWMYFSHRESQVRLDCRAMLGYSLVAWALPVSGSGLSALPYCQQQSAPGIICLSSL
ncbi:unnamed protein product [Arctogadus glacialis]